MIDGSIEFCTFFEERKQFQYGEETYAVLTLFCVEDGCFVYAIGEGEEHTVKRGQVVVCPPHVPFRRNISDGKSISEAALLCGFESNSYFTKNLKNHMGTL